MIISDSHHKLQEIKKSITDVLKDTGKLIPGIVLIGPPGAGKTSVGSEIAQRYALKYVDTDSIIESCSGVNITDIFSTYGELNFREQENYILDVMVGGAAVCETSACEMPVCGDTGNVPITPLFNLTNIKSTISTGGGMPISPGNFEKLSRLGVVIALTASPDTLLARLRNAENRPLLQTVDGNLDEQQRTDEQYKIDKRQRALELLLKERKSIYESASLVIDTTLLSIEEVAKLVITQVTHGD